MRPPLNSNSEFTDELVYFFKFKNKDLVTDLNEEVRGNIYYLQVLSTLVTNNELKNEIKSTFEKYYDLADKAGFFRY